MQQAGSQAIDFPRSPQSGRAPQLSPAKPACQTPRIDERCGWRGGPAAGAGKVGTVGGLSTGLGRGVGSVPTRVKQEAERYLDCGHCAWASWR